MIRYLFCDRGQTLVRYYTREQFKTMLPEIFQALCARLGTRLDKPAAHYWQAILNESRENADFSVRPLAARLGNAFGLSEMEVERYGLSGVFMAPIMKTSAIYEDTKPILEVLRGKYAMALVSNTPWGCPQSYFARELVKYDIEKYFDAVVFCTDVGFRKPHGKIFRYALRRMNALPGETLMIGDRPDWDIAGARECGQTAVLIDRAGPCETDSMKIRSLRELPEAIEGFPSLRQSRDGSFTDDLDSPPPPVIMAS
jgi:HAD superfamily hydrolase (TIGR01549 family)